MFGAVIGDVIGSVYEWNNIKSKDFPLFSKNCTFTDDTILTSAASDWAVNGGDAEKIIRKWGNKYKERSTFGKGAFSKGFLSWLEDESKGAYQSRANGAVMRISPIPFLIRDTKKAIAKALEFTNVTHNHVESLDAVEAYVEVMHANFKKNSVEEIKGFVADKFGYDMSRSVDEIRANYKGFPWKCIDTVPEAMICALDANSYEDAVRNAVSLGGDSDTLAAMAGALAEARFGMDDKIRQEGVKYLDVNVKFALYRQYSVYGGEQSLQICRHDAKNR